LPRQDNCHFILQRFPTVADKELISNIKDISYHKFYILTTSFSLSLQPHNRSVPQILSSNLFLVPFRLSSRILYSDPTNAALLGVR